MTAASQSLFAPEINQYNTIVFTYSLESNLLYIFIRHRLRYGRSRTSIENFAATLAIVCKGNNFRSKTHRSYLLRNVSFFGNNGLCYKTQIIYLPIQYFGESFFYTTKNFLSSFSIPSSAKAAIINKEIAGFPCTFSVVAKTDSNSLISLALSTAHVNSSCKGVALYLLPHSL